MKEDIKILIVEDEGITAESLKLVLLNIGYQISGVVNNAIDALDILANNKTDLAIIDINIYGDKDGIWLANYINKIYQIPFIYLTAYEDDITIKKALDTKPHGYLLKPFVKANIATAIEIALANFNKRETNEEKILQTVSKYNLTKREAAILIQISLGLDNQQIAEKLFISINTVKYHTRNIYEKLDVKKRTEITSKLLFKNQA